MRHEGETNLTVLEAKSKVKHKVPGVQGDQAEGLILIRRRVTTARRLREKYLILNVSFKKRVRIVIRAFFVYEGQLQNNSIWSLPLSRSAGEGATPPPLSIPFQVIPVMIKCQSHFRGTDR